jgi:hypothetical protein
VRWAPASKERSPTFKKEVLLSPTTITRYKKAHHDDFLVERALDGLRFLPLAFLWASVLSVLRGRKTRGMMTSRFCVGRFR